MMNRYLPDYCGFIIDFPKSHRSRTPDQVRELVKELDRAHVSAVGVFVDEPAEIVAELLNDGTIDMAQLHGSESEAYIANLRTMTSGKVVRAFALKKTEVLKAAAASTADHILLDQGQGSGETFDWSMLGSPEAIEAFGAEGLPQGEWFLAGGLNEENIASAIERFRPYAVDLSSAVETDRVKDEAKVRRIIEIVRSRR